MACFMVSTQFYVFREKSEYLLDTLADTGVDVSRQIFELAPNCTAALVYEMVKIRKSTFWIRLAKLRPRAAYSDRQY